MVQSLDYDTIEPRNLWDWELSEDMTALPPARPYHEKTPVSYLLAKGKILFVLGKIVNLLSSFKQYPYEAVLKLDDELHMVYEDLPPHFRMETLEVNDTQSVVNRQAQLQFLYLQGMCVLHRKFFVQGRLNPRFLRSYTRCTESATNLLRQQYFLFQESKVEGSLVAKHWYRISYTSQDFILAAMILVLDIKHRRNEETAESMAVGGGIQPEVLQVLQKACQIWKGESAANKSSEAVQVYRVLANMLLSLGIPETPEIPYVQQASTPVQLSPWMQGPLYLDMSVPELNMDIDWVSCTQRT
jgi:hypothetical protein